MPTLSSLGAAGGKAQGDGTQGIQAGESQVIKHSLPTLDVPGIGPGEMNTTNKTKQNKMIVPDFKELIFNRKR